MNSVPREYFENNNKKGKENQMNNLRIKNKSNKDVDLRNFMFPENVHILNPPLE